MLGCHPWVLNCTHWVLLHIFAVFMKPLTASLGALSQHYLGVSSTKMFVKNQYIVKIPSQNNTIYINANSSFLLQKCASSIMSVCIFMSHMATCDGVKVHPLTASSGSDPFFNKCYKIEDCSFVRAHLQEYNGFRRLYSVRQVQSQFVPESAITCTRSEVQTHAYQFSTPHMCVHTALYSFLYSLVHKLTASTHSIASSVYTSS